MKSRWIAIPFTAGLLPSCLHALAQSGPPSNPPPLTTTDKAVAVPLLSNQELILSIVVLLFGVYVVTLEYKLLIAAKSRADEALRALTVTLIVVISLALVSSGYGKEQIVPVLGLFGTIVGYLLGAGRAAPAPGVKEKEKETASQDGEKEDAN